MVMGLTTDVLRRKQNEVGIELEKRKDPSPSNVGSATKLQARQLFGHLDVLGGRAMSMAAGNTEAS
jgi:hypothetical protein